MAVLDPKFRERWGSVAEQATRQHRDCLETANSYGLLATPELRQFERLKTLEALWRRLDDQSPAKLLMHYTGKGHGTPEDMLRATLEWLEDVIRAVKEEEIAG